MTETKKSITARMIIQMVIFIGIMPFLPLLISQRWDWWEAWVYGIISVVGFIISRRLAVQRNPDILTEPRQLWQTGRHPAVGQDIIAAGCPGRISHPGSSRL
jgi:hypothetical protein